MPNASTGEHASPGADAAASVFVGGGEMGALMRSLDWSKTPLGPVETWPQSLRMMVRFLLANRFPLLLWWGPQYASIHNDAYRPILGRKHPASMGQPVRECWHEIWHILQPLIDTPFNGGPSTWMEDIGLEINRHGYVEETHFTIAYSPVPDETAPRGTGGVLATVHERDALTRIQRSGKHLLALINDVLNFAKLEAGRVEYEPRNVTLADAVAAVSPMIDSQLRAKDRSSHWCCRGDRDA